MKYMQIFWATLIIISTGTSVMGQMETPITIRVKAHDAKWIGTSMGGVDIIIRDQTTGEILAKGRTAGSTGNTNLLVLGDKSRYGSISTEGSAGFHVNLPLKNPVFSEIEATFRTAYSGHPITMTKSLWLIPGKDMTGDGIVLDMPGFAMRIGHPQPHQSVSLSTDGDARIDLFLIMLCGCPIEPGGTWDCDPMDIEAMIYQNDKWLKTVDFEFVETNHFTADLTDLPPGSYTAYVSVYDPRSLNTGVEKVQVTINN